MKTITLARKPISQSVAKNVLEHGCGGLNINASRIRTLDTLSIGSNNRESASVNFGMKNDLEAQGQHEGGRFPANLILQHLDGCEQDGVRYVKGHKGYPNGPGGIWKKGYQQDNPDAIGYTQCSTVTDNEPWKGHADKDGKESVANWICEQGCPVKALDEQSGVSKSTGGRIGNAGGAYSGLGPTGFTNAHQAGDPGFGDEGGASRFFKQVKS